MINQRGKKMTFEEYCKGNELEPNPNYKIWFEKGAREVANEICSLFGVTACAENELKFLKTLGIILSTDFAPQNNAPAHIQNAY